MPGAVARRYARALYELAEEERDVEATGQRLAVTAQALAAAATQSDGAALDSAVWRQLGEALAHAFGLDSTFGKFLRLLGIRVRLGELPLICRCYLRMQDAAVGRVRLQIRSAETLGQETIAAVEAVFQRISKREIVAEFEVDRELLGGLVVELEGRIYDGSVRTQLSRLAACMAG